MQAFARSTVRVIQNCFLDRLFRGAILIPIGMIGGWMKLSEGWPTFTSALILAAICAVAWIIGTLAIPDDKPANASGLAVWETEPEDGRHPPAMIRRLVTLLGADPEHPREWLRMLLFVLMMAGLFLALGLAYKSSTYWEGVHPALAELQVRQGLYVGIVGLIFLICVRSWASQQRAYLNPVERKPAESGGGASVAVMGSWPCWAWPWP